MTDFAAAFKQGQVAAQLAIKAKTEIDEAFSAFSRGLSDATNGKLTAFRAEYSSLPGLINSAIASMAETSRPQPKESWICVRNLLAENTKDKKLARWERPHEGFPCTIIYDKQQVRCHDRDGLESALADFLSNAWVGEQLRELLERPLKPNLGSASQPIRSDEAASSNPADDASP